MSLKGTGIILDLHTSLRSSGIEEGSPEAYKYIKDAYITAEIDRCSLERQLSRKEIDYTWLKRQRNVLALLSALLASLCLFFALQGPSSQAPAADPAPISTTQTVQRTSGKYVASVNSGKFHRTSCRHAGDILKENRIYYATAKEAEADGKTPCSICRP